MLIKLHDRVFIRGHTRKRNHENLLAELKANYVKCVVNVALISDPEFRDLVREHDIVYWHVPLNDSKALPINRVNQLIKDVVEEIDGGYGVLIHCDSGFNRSALIAIPIIKHYTDHSMDSIISAARKIRPKILKNKTFESFVLNYRRW